MPSRPAPGPSPARGSPAMEEMEPKAQQLTGAQGLDHDPQMETGSSSLGPGKAAATASCPQVALRIRPLNDTELEEGAAVIAHKVGDQTVVLMDPSEDPEDPLRTHRSRAKTFIFDVVFDQHASQEDVYLATTQQLVEAVVSGYNATVFAYGPSGAGKTHTMLGTDTEPGLYLQTLSGLFQAIEETRDSTDCSVSMSYLEIYNEVIRDLLSPSSGFLDLREDSRGSIQIAGITEVSTSNAQEITQLLTKGNRQRTQEPTATNKTSPRSHAVLQVLVRRRGRGAHPAEEVRVGRLFMVDLAGSERASQTQNQGKRMKEGAHINRSLLALGNCVNALSEKGGSRAQYENFRDSKLTRLLKDALGGNSRTVMIAHVSPASTHLEESRTTLLYAYRAKNIKTRVKRNLLSVSYHIAQYMDVISDLRGQIQCLKAKVERQERERRGEPGGRDAQDEQDQGPSFIPLPVAELGHWEQEKTHHLVPRAGTPERDEEALEAGPEGGEGEPAEPHEVALAREEVNMLLAKQQKTAALKVPGAQGLSWVVWDFGLLINRPGNRRFQYLSWVMTAAQTVEPWSPEATTSEQEMKDTVNAGHALTVNPAGLCERDCKPECKDERAWQQRPRASALIPWSLHQPGLEQRLANAKKKASQMGELLPTQVISEDQREVLRLLCRAHELEVENAGLQASSLCRRNLLCQKDFVIQRCQQHRRLCERIIREQQQLIQDSGLAVPEALEQQYRLYSRELDAGTLNRLLLLHTMMASSLRDGSVLNISPPPEEPSQDQLDDREDLPWGAQFELLPMLLDPDSDGYKSSKATPLKKLGKPDSLLPPSSLHTLLSPPAHEGAQGPSELAQGERERSFRNAGCPEAAITTVLTVYWKPSSQSMKTLVSKLCSPAGREPGTPTLRMVAEAGLSAQALKEMAAGTKSIALTAATRRSRAQDREGSSGRSSLHPPEEVAPDPKDPKPSITLETSPAGRKWPQASPGRARSAEKKARGKPSAPLTRSIQPTSTHCTGRRHTRSRLSEPGDLGHDRSPHAPALVGCAAAAPGTPGLT
ncbi:kinesin-like protein KIF19 [Oryx dammah]|uniref:kinesin-like protein KIF19 n=1 Tax=Oryx dammah TaxID=59534 RepID=UPI001A9BC7ED|nr:kinesin-like protein KIF19 [Oryx dammah]